MENMKNHLVLNGKDSSFRVWRGLGNKHSLDEEWEVEFRRPIDREKLGLG
jgi:hypothetical protein